MSQALALLLAVSLGVGGYVLTEQDLIGIHNGAREVLVEVQTNNDLQFIQAAVLMYQSDRDTTETPSVEQLVSTGYIDPKFLNHKLVKDELKEMPQQQ